MNLWFEHHLINQNASENYELKYSIYVTILWYKLTGFAWEINLFETISFAIKYLLNLRAENIFALNF